MGATRLAEGLEVVGGDTGPLVPGGGETGGGVPGLRVKRAKAGDADVGIRAGWAGLL